MIEYQVSVFSLYNPAEEERAGYFALNVFRLACDCLDSVSLPHRAVGWSVVCLSGIFWSYSFVFFFFDSLAYIFSMKIRT